MTLKNSIILPAKQNFQQFATVLPTGFENSELIYRWSRDEQSNKGLHTLVDNKDERTPLLILVQTNEFKKFGAYTDLGLDKIGGWRKSKNCYLFACNDNIPVTCPIIQGQQTTAQYFDLKYGLVFGNGDLKIDLDQASNCYSKLGSSY